MSQLKPTNAALQGTADRAHLASGGSVGLLVATA
jgi:hypothetical protein